MTVCALNPLKSASSAKSAFKSFDYKIAVLYAYTKISFTAANILRLLHTEIVEMSLGVIDFLLHDLGDGHCVGFGTGLVK